MFADIGILPSKQRIPQKSQRISRRGTCIQQSHSDLRRTRCDRKRNVTRIPTKFNLRGGGIKGAADHQTWARTGRQHHGVVWSLSACQKQIGITPHPECDNISIWGGGHHSSCLRDASLRAIHQKNDHYGFTSFPFAFNYSTTGSSSKGGLCTHGIRTKSWVTQKPWGFSSCQWGGEWSRFTLACTTRETKIQLGGIITAAGAVTGMMHATPSLVTEGEGEGDDE